MKKKGLKLEFTDEVKSKVGETDFQIGKKTIMVTPQINENYWVLRVKLHKNQSIIAFPKFMTMGIGFAQEIDWDTNFPYTCKAVDIFNHIKKNKKYKAISDGDCIKAIEMIQNFIKRNHLVEEFYK